MTRAFLAGLGVLGSLAACNGAVEQPAGGSSGSAAIGTTSSSGSGTGGWGASSSVSTGGSDGSSPPVADASTSPTGVVDAAGVARAYVAASLAQGTATGNCNFGSTASIVRIGAQDPTRPISDTNPTRVDDGSSQGGAVSIACIVHPDGSAFEVQLSAAVVNGLVGGGGAMTLVGIVDPTAGGTGLHGTFVNAGVEYDDVSCSLQFTDRGQPISLANDAPKVAAGRIWAHVDCPDATAVASGQIFVCDAQADFVFENCGM